MIITSCSFKIRFLYLLTFKNNKINSNSTLRLFLKSQKTCLLYLTVFTKKNKNFVNFFLMFTYYLSVIKFFKKKIKIKKTKLITFVTKHNLKNKNLNYKKIFNYYNFKRYFNTVFTKFFCLCPKAISYSSLRINFSLHFLHFNILNFFILFFLKYSSLFFFMIKSNKKLVVILSMLRSGMYNTDLCLNFFCLNFFCLNFMSLISDFFFYFFYLNLYQLLNFNFKFIFFCLLIFFNYKEDFLIVFKLYFIVKLNKFKYYKNIYSINYFNFFPKYPVQIIKANMKIFCFNLFTLTQPHNLGFLRSVSLSTIFVKFLDFFFFFYKLFYCKLFFSFFRTLIFFKMFYVILNATTLANLISKSTLKKFIPVNYFFFLNNLICHSIIWLNFLNFYLHKLLLVVNFMFILKRNNTFFLISNNLNKILIHGSSGLALSKKFSKTENLKKLKNPITKRTFNYKFAFKNFFKKKKGPLARSSMSAGYIFNFLFFQFWGFNFIPTKFHFLKSKNFMVLNNFLFFKNVKKYKKFMLLFLRKFHIKGKRRKIKSIFIRLFYFSFYKKLFKKKNKKYLLQSRFYPNFTKRNKFLYFNVYFKGYSFTLKASKFSKKNVLNSFFRIRSSLKNLLNRKYLIPLSFYSTLNLPYGKGVTSKNRQRRKRVKSFKFF